MADVSTKVTGIIGRTEVTFQDKRTGGDVTLPKFVVSAEDGKVYEWMTKATVEVGTEMKGTAETDTRSGMLRFKPERTGGAGGGWGGGRGKSAEELDIERTGIAVAMLAAKLTPGDVAAAKRELFPVATVQAAMPGATEVPISEPSSEELAKSDANAAAEAMDI